ncbi:MAG: type III pantothenate kinase [Coprobacillus sp.]|nr:type III pantothenate kinase [Coprobacillus sp.]
MNLCVDVGNSTIVLGIFKDGKLLDKYRIKTRLYSTESEFTLSIRSLFHDFDITQISEIIYSSVVPTLNHALISAIENVFHLEPLTISSGVKTGVEIKVENPNEIGNDLIADLAAAKALYSYPTLVVDLGTASKILCLDKNGAFVTALIMPGLVSGAKLLKDSTELLPDVGLTKPSSFVAKNTNSAINNGLIYGHAEMIKGLVNRYNKEFDCRFNVVVTGGCSNLIKDFVEEDYIFDEDLTLKGLNIILEKNSK